MSSGSTRGTPSSAACLAPDVVIQDASTLQALNAYTYVLNNPLSLTDPTGYFFSGLFKAIGNAFKSAFKAIGSAFKAVLKSIRAARLLRRNNLYFKGPGSDERTGRAPLIPRECEDFPGFG